MIRITGLLGSLILASFALQARPPLEACGTSRLAHLEAAYLHGRAQQARAAVPQLATAAPPALARDFGDVAVIDGSLGVIAPPNTFTLTGRILRFAPEPGGYRLSVLDNPNSAPNAAAVPIDGLGDDDHHAVPLPFDFPFYGTTYREALVHSDGNVTFRTPDDGFSARTLGRLVAGPPRIAPLFADLDPSRAPGSVRILTEPGRVTFIWLDVPEFSAFPAGGRQTFEVALTAAGGVEMAFYEVTALSHITGMGPGGLGGQTRVVPLAESSGQRFDATVAEPFTRTPVLDPARLAQRFYESHDDGFDYLVVFNTARLAAASGALATQTTVRAFTHGIGDTFVEDSQLYGSRRRRLQAFLNMGPLAQYPADPHAPVGARGRLTGDTTLSLLAHEAGHLFLALASVRVPGDPDARPMLGAGLVHWSFNFNSDASVMEGNRIADSGTDTPGGRFLTTGAVEHFSALDQYLMGLRAPWEVPPSFVVWPSAIQPNRLPQTGFRFSGERRDITVDELIEVEGPRAPSHEVAQRRFRFAFILVSEEGRWPTTAEIEQVDLYRRAFAGHFHEISDTRAWADTTLRGSLGLSAWPMAGLLAGGEAPVRLSRPLVEPDPLTIGLHTTHGHLEAPHEATIPAGMAETEFILSARSAGVADLVAEPRSGNAAPVFARIKVAASPEDLELRLHYREGPLVFIRVTDWEDINYGGVPLLVSGAECIAPASCRSGADGLLRLHVPGAAGVEIEGAPGSLLSIQP